ncbi:MAG: zinc-regulated TonB-dependent outer membrane receptor [Lentisphaerae bacterium]|jgi:hypothetical protein|nr:zinc-regulated TonB-dependent outer membrane receptor [Lentisphaerota bacterium]
MRPTLFKITLLPAIFGLALLTFSASAQEVSTTDLLRQLKLMQEQMNDMRSNYDAQIKKLQEEIKTLKSKPTTAAAATEATVIKSESSRLAGSTTADAEQDLYQTLKKRATEWLPPSPIPGLDLDAAVVVDAFYHYDNDKEGVDHLKGSMGGFGGHAHDHGEEGHSHSHSHSHIKDGFNMRHVELSLSAAVDPYFEAWANMAFDDDGAELEEAVIQTSNLPWGLTLSVGKIKSGIGRVNRQHSHSWDFLDAPLIHESLFGAHGLTEKGLQLTWLAPTPFYLLFGAEAFNGDNEKLFNEVDSDDFPHHNGPRLWTSFVKFGPDLGDRHAMQLGLSYTQGRHQLLETHGDHAHRFDGDNRIYGVDAVYKYNAGRSHGHGDLVVQAEYFFRDSDMELLNNGRDFSTRQDGYYLQALYGILPRWRLGLRWDQVGLKNTVEDPHEGEIKYGASNRATAMLDWKLSEFSLLRFQLANCNFATAAGRQHAWEMAMQLQILIGKHAAHDF